MSGKLLSCALVGLAACSSDEPTTTTAADSGDRDALADASADVSSEISSTSDAATETSGGRNLTAGTCGATRWNARYGSSAEAGALPRNQGLAVAADAMGNVFATGIYVGGVDFGGGARPTGLQNSSMFLVKLDPAGAHVWSKGFGDPGPGLFASPSVQGFAVAADANANVVVAGVMAGIVDFGGGALKSAGPPLPEGGLEALEEAGLGDSGLFGGCASGIFDCSFDALVAKYDANGAHRWSKIFGAGGGDSVRGVAFDSQGDVYLTGGFESTMNVGGPSFSSAGKQDAWVAKLDPDGKHLWSIRLGGAGDETGESIAADSAGNAIVSGVFSGMAPFGADSFTSVGEFDAFVVKLDVADGHVLWAKQAKSSEHAAANAVAVDKQGAIAVAGHHRGTMDWGSGATQSVFADDIFVTKLDPTGKPAWVKSFGANGNDRGFGVAFDQAGHIVATGLVRSPNGIDFGGGRIGGGLDQGAFVVQLDSASGHVCSRSYAPASASGVAVDTAGNVIVTGSFSGKLDLGLGPMTSAGAADIFVASFAP